MSSRTASDWIEFFSRYKPTEIVYAIVYDKEDTRGVNDSDITLKDEDWAVIANNIDSDYVHDRLWENLTEAMESQIGEYSCEDCGAYDYEVLQVETDEISGQVCRKCGEEEDLLEVK